MSEISSPWFKDRKFVAQLIFGIFTFISVVIAIVKFERCNLKIEYTYPTSIVDTLFANDSIKICYKNSSLKALYKSSIYLTNSGSTPLKSETFESEAPLRILFEDNADILFCSLSCNANQSFDTLYYSKNFKNVYYKFSLLNGNEFVVIDIFHKKNSPIVFKVKAKLENGVIKGPSVLSSNLPNNLELFTSSFISLFGNRIFATLFLILLLGVSGLKSYISFFEFKSRISNSFKKIIWFCVFGLSDMIVLSLIILLLIY